MNSEPIRRATSEDGTLTLGLFDEDDFYLGFQGQAWHTHGDLLVPEYGDSPESAAHAFFDSVLADEQVICISDALAAERSVWITDAPAKELKYVQLGETLVMRFWSGRIYDLTVPNEVA